MASERAVVLMQLQQQLAILFLHQLQHVANGVWEKYWMSTSSLHKVGIITWVSSSLSRTQTSSISIHRALNGKTLPTCAGGVLTFGKVFTEHSATSHDPQGVLSLLLASMVHHSSWMLGVIEKYPSHPFGKITLLNSNLLHNLKSNHLTMELNEHAPMVTGMPPHVMQLQ
jgi:hypothetical protein